MIGKLVRPAGSTTTLCGAVWLCICLAVNACAAGDTLARSDTERAVPQSTIILETELQSPSDIAGCVLWLDASDEQTVELEDGLVSVWRDKSAAKRDFNQPLESNRPRLEPAGMNGQPAVRFDGHDDYLSCIRSLELEPDPAFSVFVVMRSLSGKQWLYVGPMEKVPGQQAFLFTSSPSFQCTHVQVEFGSNKLSDEAPHLAVYQRKRLDEDSVHYGMWVDGFPAYPTLERYSGDRLRVASRKTRLGAGEVTRDNWKGLREDHREHYAPFAGQLSEVLVYERTLSEFEVERISRYLTRKWFLETAYRGDDSEKDNRHYLPGVHKSPIRLAVVSSSRDEKVLGYAELLQHEMLGTPGIELVERGEIERVLQEQELHTAFQADGIKARTQLGKLLRADLLLLLNRPEDSNPRNPGKKKLHLALADVASGIRFSSTEPLDEHFTKQEPLYNLTRWVEQSVLRMRKGYTRVVAVPPFQSGDADMKSLYLRGSYALLAQQVLLHYPDTLVVELGEAETLAREYMVTSGPEEVLRPLPYFLRGRYRHESTGSGREIKIHLQLEYGGKQLGEADLEPGPVDEMGVRLLGAMAPLFNIPVAAVSAQLASRYEARRLCRYGVDLLEAGYRDDAVRILETAGLLDQEYGDPYIHLAALYKQQAEHLINKQPHTADSLDAFYGSVELTLETLERALPRAKHIGELGKIVVPLQSLRDLARPRHKDIQRSNKIFAKGIELMCSFLTQMPDLHWHYLFQDVGSITYYTTTYYQENGFEMRTRMLLDVLHSLSNNPDRFPMQVNILKDLLGNPGIGSFREAITRTSDPVILSALEVAEWLQQIEGDAFIHKQAIQFVKQHKTLDDRRKRMMLTRLNVHGPNDAEANISRRAADDPRWVLDEKIPEVKVTALRGPVRDGIRDWINAAPGSEYVATDSGLYRVRPGDGQPQWKQLSAKAFRQLCWDGTYLWALRDDGLELRSSEGELLRFFTEEEAGITIRGSAHRLVATGEGRIAACGRFDSKDLQRSWVVELVFKPGGQGGTFLQKRSVYTSSEDEAMPLIELDFAMTPGALPSRHLLLPYYLLDLDQETLAPIKHLYNRAYYKGFPSVYAEGKLFRGMRPVKSASAVYLVQNWKTPGKRDRARRSFTRVLKWRDPMGPPQILVDHPVRPRCTNHGGGAVLEGVLAAFVVGQDLHIIPGYKCEAPQPKWYAVDLNSGKTKTVAYHVPYMLLDHLSFGRVKRIHASSVMGPVFLLESGVAYHLELPPRDRWGFYGMEEDREREVYDDRNSIGHQLASLKEEDVVERVQSGWNINQSDELGRTAVYQAVLKSNPALLKCLIEQEADLLVLDYKGKSALSHALEKGVAENILKQLLEAGADPNHYGAKAEPPLSIAVKTRNLGGVRLLLDHGANPDVWDAKGATPLFESATKPTFSMAICDLLVKAGADVNMKNKKSGLTPLHAASWWGATYPTKYLLQHGANPFLKGDFRGQHLDALGVFTVYRGKDGAQHPVAVALQQARAAWEKEAMPPRGKER